jgi:hypothetical protein
VNVDYTVNEALEFADGSAMQWASVLADEVRRLRAIEQRAISLAVAGPASGDRRYSLAAKYILGEEDR